MLTELSGIQRQVIISLCLYLGQMMSAYTMCWSGPVIPKLRDLEQSPIPYLLTEAQLSLVATLIYIGGVLGPYFTLWLSNTRGRKPSIISSGVISAISYIILATSKNLVLVYISRIIGGMSIGTSIVINVVYLGEIASTNIRGILLTGMGIFNTLGSVLMFSVGPFISYLGVTYVALALNIVYIIFAFYIPESPIFYLVQGKNEEVTEVLKYLGRSEDVEKLLNTKREFTATNTKKEWKELFTVRSNRNSLFILLIINIFQQCTGIFTLLFFSAAIFEMAGSSINSDISMIIVTCFRLLGSTVTPFFIERIGRKRILLLSCVVCSLSMFLMGLYFYLSHIGSPVIDNVKWLPLLLLILFFVGYDFGIGIIPNVLTGEMFASNVRSKGSMLTLTLSWLVGFTATTTIGALLSTVGGHVAFWFFSCICVCACVFTIFFIPETKGKSLTEIEEAL